MASSKRPPAFRIQEGPWRPSRRAAPISARHRRVLRTVVANPESGNSPDFLTEREREILQLVAEGNSTKDIAAKLGISMKTVDNHRTNLMRKLNMHDVASLTRHAFDRASSADRGRLAPRFPLKFPCGVKRWPKMTLSI
jgi:DNA-binding NarL/FixJ family response regulator